MSDAAHTPAPEGQEAPIWNEDFYPPPWSAIRTEDTGLWQVVCDGYDDETPVVAAGTLDWPMEEGDARIMSAALDLLDVARKFLAFAESGAHYAYPVGSVQELREAIAKADHRDGRGI